MLVAPGQVELVAVVRASLKIGHAAVRHQQHDAAGRLGDAATPRQPIRSPRKTKESTASTSGDTARRGTRVREQYDAQERKADGQPGGKISTGPTSSTRILRCQRRSIPR